MTFLRYLFLGALALCLVVLAIANREPVTVRLLPEGLGSYVGLGEGLTFPLFVVLFVMMAVGLLIGFVWEWLREHKHRAAARSERAQKEKLEAELNKSRAHAPDDDVLALLEPKT